MIWRINGQDYPVIPLASLLGGATGATAVAFGLLFEVGWVQVTWMGVASGAAGFLLLIILFLLDIGHTARVEGDTRRAKLRAAQRIYQAWAEGTIEPPTELKTATYRVGGEVRPLQWLQDDDPETGKWRNLLIALFQYARAYNRETRGERTGLTEVDMVGTSAIHMFPGREGYLAAIKVAKELGLVERVNGVPTRLGDTWTFTKVITYLQTAAVLPPITEKAPHFRAYTGAVR